MKNHVYVVNSSNSDKLAYVGPRDEIAKIVQDAFKKAIREILNDQMAKKRRNTALG